VLPLARSAMRTLLLAFLLLPFNSFADEVRIAIGLNHQDGKESTG
jgi:hypothetical protein